MRHIALLVTIYFIGVGMMTFVTKASALERVEKLSGYTKKYSKVISLNRSTLDASKTMVNITDSRIPILEANQKALCYQIDTQRHREKYLGYGTFANDLLEPSLGACDEDKQTDSTPTSNTRFSSMNADGGPPMMGEVVYTDDVSFSIAPSTHTLYAGDTAVFDVAIQWDDSTQMIVSTGSELGPTQLFKITKNIPIFVHSGINNFQITVETSPMLSAGEYEFYILGLTNESYYTHMQHYTLNIIENESAATDPLNNYTNVEFNETWLSGPTIAPYQGAYAAVQAGAYYDVNNDGLLNAADGNNTTVFPAMPDAYLNVEQGKAFAGDANIIVSAVLSEHDFVVVHFQVQNDGSVMPILAIAGNTSNGIIMLQDVDLINFSLEGELPSANGNGYIIGSISFDPFLYDGRPDQNVIYANHVDLAFSLALQGDGS